MGDKKIHFGWYVASVLNAKGKSVQAALVENAGIGARRLSQILQMEKPPQSSFIEVELPALLGMDSASLSHAWQNTPVEQPPMRKSASEQKEFAAVRKLIKAVAEEEDVRPAVLVAAMLAAFKRVTSQGVTVEQLLQDGRSLASTADRGMKGGQGGTGSNRISSQSDVHPMDEGAEIG